MSVASILEFLCHGFNVPKGDLRQFTYVPGREWESGRKTKTSTVYLVRIIFYVSCRENELATTKWEDYINSVLHLVCITHNFRSLHVLNTSSDNEHRSFFRCFSFGSFRFNKHKIWWTIFLSSKHQILNQTRSHSKRD